MRDDPPTAVTLRRWSELDTAEHAQLHRALDQIFFEASNTKSFASEELRTAFRHRWLGRYLVAEPHLAHILFLGAHPDPVDLAGYVIGAHDDPARTDRYADIGYFPLLADLTRQFPAHLHINLRHDVRGRGLGGTLLECFVSDVAAQGGAGLHVVTGAGLRNVHFYRRHGFDTTHSFMWKGNELLFLGRRTA